MKKGFLISIEGIDGSGKSTLAHNLANMLEQSGHSVLVTKQPGGTELGKTLRQILHTQKEIVCDKAEFLLFAADRAQHMTSVVIPAIKEGKIVISDRMHDSSLAYQGFGRGLDCSIIEQVNRWTLDEIFQDLTFYVKLDYKTALDRIFKNRNEITSFEKEKNDFWNRVVEGFETIFANRQDVVTLDGKQNQDKLAHQAYQVVLEKI